MRTFKQIRFEWRLKCEIKKANKLFALTKFKYFVLMSKGKMITVSKRRLKELIKNKQMPGTIQEIERKALYVTK